MILALLDTNKNNKPTYLEFLQQSRSRAAEVLQQYRSFLQEALDNRSTNAKTDYTRLYCPEDRQAQIHPERFQDLAINPKVAHALLNELKKYEDRYQPLLNKIDNYMQDPNNDNDLTGLLKLSEEVESHLKPRDHLSSMEQSQMALLCDKKKIQ